LDVPASTGRNRTERSPLPALSYAKSMGSQEEFLMNADERNPGQQGYGQQSPQQSQGQQANSQQQQQSETMQQGQQADSMETGQASYGNSGEADLLSQNSSSMGQESDMGQSGEGSSLFSGSEDDMGGSSSGQAMSDQGSQSDQSSADQGQSALNEDLMGSDGITDIEVERSQGRESDIEGNSL
jgi:hypothetical protein